MTLILYLLGFEYPSSKDTSSLKAPNSLREVGLIPIDFPWSLMKGGSLLGVPPVEFDNKQAVIFIGKNSASSASGN